MDEDEEQQRQSTPTNTHLTPQYEGDDVRPTSDKELLGWYGYGWAAEAFVVCAMDASQCLIWFFGHKVNTASFAMYTFSISVAIQSLLIISMSAAADHGMFRKRFLLIFAFIGSISLMLFIGVSARFYILAGLIAVISNTCFGASFVLLNSFLPLLVRHHPSVRSSTQQDDTSRPGNAASTSERTPLLQEHTSDVAANEAPNESLDSSKSHSMSSELALSTKISSWGMGIGYVGSLVSLGISIGIVVATGSTTFSLRLALFAIGLWWFIFTIPAGLYLRPRPGPPLPGTRTSSKVGIWFQYLAFAWKSLGRTAMSVRYLKDALLFLLAWFCLSDGIATVSGTAVLFAKTQLNMSVAALAMINVTAMLSGVFGAFMWNFISQKFNWSASQTILACVCLFELIPFYGILGFVPQIQQFGHFGLQEPWEMYPLGAVYGIVMAGLSSYCRSIFGELIPPNFEASFYALYAITDKGSSVFGPAVVGMIIDRYGQIRPAFWFLAILILLPLPLMLLVDVERGRRDAALLSKELEEVGSQGENQYS
ncbi:hypothetical protein KEM56_000904 [Ascosphaera pollenicola]|nr:hypothetical protein KEM56_000904 [Ascosphaera pollenicola]